MKIQNNHNFKVNLRLDKSRSRSRKMNRSEIMNTMNNMKNTNNNKGLKMYMKEHNNFITLQANSKNLSFFLILFIALAGLVLNSSEVLAVKDAADAGLSVGVTNLMGILNNKLTPVVLVAGCLSSLAYSLAIAQPKPFIMGLVTLCGFGFAKAWIAGTYALVG